MTQNEKELLIKDLCARVPYNVKVSFRSNRTHVIKSIHPSGLIITNDSVTKAITTTDVENTKPYLFPMSSMTEEQFEELKAFAGLTYECNTLELVEWDSTCDKTLEFWLEEIPSYCVIKVFDWLNAHHFDYRGLIDKGLAIDATGKNIY